MGLPTKFTRPLASFLTNRTIKFKVRVGNEISEAVTLQAGNPQGSVLSPTLFIIYVNDIPVDSRRNVEVSQYIYIYIYTLNVLHMT